MQKKLIFAVVLIFTLAVSGLFAQYEFMHRNGSFWGDGSSFRFFAPDVVEFGHWDGRQRISRMGTYSIEYKYSVPFLNLNWADGTADRYLMLVNDMVMFLYADNTEPRWNLRWLSGYEEGIQPGLSPMVSASASASLSEGNLHFAATPERLGLHINRVCPLFTTVFISV